ncbi:methyl-accepting chemotaxis protein [Bacillus sp. OxB-1]|uniref:methyl-accepting chemotaxis protein n=1 Tax=Bacillus sp. (strain OxB-1) TaxID=98228 RepID=UPI000581B784|nr:methyl-accepting chemotaxis protein [Bacillus sp. OxB-1]BAQ09535.1 methyl-accepting chemotaxis protein [Bacillus sp. OxB-1]
MRLLKNVPLKFKLLLTVFAIIMALVAVTTMQSISQLQSQLESNLEQELKSVGLLTAMQLKPQEVENLFTVKGETDPDFIEVQNNLDHIVDQQGIMFWSYIWKMEDGGVNPVGYTNNLNDVYEVGELFTDIAPDHMTAAKLAIEHDRPEVTRIFEDSFGTWRTVFSPLKDANGKTIAVLGIDYSADYIQATINKSITKQIAIAVAGLVILLAVLYFIIIRLLSPLNKAVLIANQVAGGDLRKVELDESKDEVGKLSGSINEMVSDLQHVILNIRNTSNAVASSATQLTTTAKESYHNATNVSREVDHLAKNAETTMVMTVETATAMEESATSIQQIAGAAHSVSESSDFTSNAAKEGHEVIQQVIDQMQLIDESVNQIDATVQGLNDNSNRIGNIVDFITDIAEQTNLLALNAAIEAARAGEHGKGFAVVAGEVKKLAEQSAHSASEIYMLIQHIQSNSNDSILAMEKGKENVRVGLDRTARAGEIFQGIVNSAEQVASQIQEISAASQEISASSEEVAASVNNMKAASEQSAEFSTNVSKLTNEQLRSMQEVKEAAMLLDKTAEELQSLITRFKL